MFTFITYSTFENTNTNDIKNLPTNIFSKLGSKCESSNVTLSYRNNNKTCIHVFGSRESGKTSFVIRVSENRFDNFYIPSISTEITDSQCVLNLQHYKIRFIVKQFEEFDPKCIEFGDYIYVFYDESNTSSLNEAKEFIISIRKQQIGDNIYVFLIGNKCENKTITTTEQELKAFCNSNNCQLFHISVKCNTGIPKLLRTIIQEDKQNNLLYPYSDRLHV